MKWKKREAKNFKFVLEKDYFPDTDSVAKGAKIFDENIEDPAAAVEVGGKDDDLELVEGNKSDKNNLKDLFLNEC